MPLVNEIPNESLREQDLPPPTDRWDQALTRFARSFDGYKHIWLPTHPDGSLPANGRASIQLLSQFYSRIFRSWSEAGHMPEPISLSDLRACLFFTERKRYWSSDQDGSANVTQRLAFAHALVEAIHRLIPPT